MKKKTSKLVLNREKVRTLGAEEMSNAAGGTSPIGIGFGPIPPPIPSFTCWTGNFVILPYRY